MDRFYWTLQYILLFVQVQQSYSLVPPLLSSGSPSPTHFLLHQAASSPTPPLGSRKASHIPGRPDTLSHEPCCLLPQPAPRLNEFLKASQIPGRPDALSHEQAASSPTPPLGSRKASHIPGRPEPLSHEPCSLLPHPAPRLKESKP
jgi:hypothetical protein